MSEAEENNKNYKATANFWRLSWVFQLFASFFLICLIWFIYATSYTFFNVEEPLLPGRYEVDKIPNAELIRSAHIFLGYMEVYTHANAKTQFKEAFKFVASDFKKEFEQEYLNRQIQAIEANNRSQVLYMETESASVDRLDAETAVISVYGSGYKIANNLKIQQELMLTVVFKVNKGKTANPYGLEVVKFTEESLQPAQE